MTHIGTIVAAIVASLALTACEGVLEGTFSKSDCPECPECAPCPQCILNPPAATGLASSEVPNG